MNFTKLNIILTIILFLLLVGCGGKTASTAKDVDQAEADSLAQAKGIEQQIIGYWESPDLANPHYEFFAASDADDLLDRQGKVFEGEKITHLFNWQLLDSGVIVLALFDPLCDQRPLNLCKTTGTVKIQAIGSSIFNSTWNIKYEDSNGGNIKNIESKYSKKIIDFSVFTQGKFVLSKTEVFDDNLLAGEADMNTISLWIGFNRTDNNKQKLSATFEIGMKQDIKFNSDQRLAFYEEEDFFVEGIGYKTFKVKTWYEEVVLSASHGSRYSLRYELHRQIQFPNDIDPTSVRLGDFQSLWKPTISCMLVNKFIRGPTIKSTDKFFTWVNADLENDGRLDGWAGEVTFESNDQATLSVTDYITGFNSNSASRSYTWAQSDDGVVSLKSADSKITLIRFIEPISGGYNVLYEYADGGYSRHDLIYDAPPVVDESTFAGRFRFMSNNGFQEIEIWFHDDKTVTSTPDIINGHWFQDSNGDIVSYECTTMTGQDINNYSECYSAFENLPMMAFTHIRRLGFVNRDQNQYQLRYSASFYGGIFNTTSVSDDYLSLAWTYRWMRVSD